MICQINITSALVFLVALVVGSLSQGNEPPSSSSFKELLDGHWKQLQAVKPDESEEDDLQYWADFYNQCEAVFSEMVETAIAHDQLQEFAQYYVEQFGKSNESDMRWFLPAYSFVLPRTYAGPHSDESAERKLTRQFESAVAEAQVRYFLKHPELLDRYYKMVLWSRRITGHGNSHGLHFAMLRGSTRQRFLADLTEEEYWWQARHAILLMAATRRTDLLKGVEPTEIKTPFLKWYDWLEKNEPYMIDSGDGYWKLNTNFFRLPRLDHGQPNIAHPDAPFEWQWKRNRKPPSPVFIEEIATRFRCCNEKETPSP